MNSEEFVVFRFVFLFILYFMLFLDISPAGGSVYG